MVLMARHWCGPTVTLCLMILRLLVVFVLQLAKQQGDFLLVGLHADEDVEARRGPHTPIMNVHERALSVLASKYVDEVRQHGQRQLEAPIPALLWQNPPQHDKQYMHYKLHLMVC